MTAAPRLLACGFTGALVACVVASAAGWHRAEASTAIAPCFVALVACLLRLRLRGGRK